MKQEIKNNAVAVTYNPKTEVKPAGKTTPVRIKGGADLQKVVK